MAAGDNKSAVLTGKLPGTAVIRATSSGLTSTDSGTITVSAGPLAKLQLLMPGETAAPGTVSGKTGTPNAQTAGTGFSVTVNAVDANWNIVSTNDTVSLATTDANDVLPANTALVAGTRTLNLTNQNGRNFYGDGFGCHARRRDKQHQPILHRKCGGLREVAVADAG